MSIPGTQASRPERKKEGRKEIVALGRGRGWRLPDVVINSGRSLPDCSSGA